MKKISLVLLLIAVANLGAHSWPVIEPEILEFFFLGEVPGTSIQIGFSESMLIAVVVWLCALWFSRRIYNSYITKGLVSNFELIAL